MTFQEIFCAGGKYFLPRPPTLHAPNVGAATMPPGCFPPWGNNVGALRRQCNTKHLQMKFGGAATLGSPYGGAGERSEPERAWAVANMGKVRRLLPGTLSVTAFSRASSPKGRAKGRASPARLFSRGGNNVGAMRRQWQYRTFFAEIRWYYVKTLYIVNIILPIRFRSKICRETGKGTPEGVPLFGRECPISVLS